MGLVAHHQEIAEHPAAAPENPHGFYVVESSISAPVHVTVWKISQQQIDLERMLLRYKWNLQEFYIANGNPQSIQEKINLLESRVGPCLVRCETIEERLANLEFKYLDENRLLTGPDSSDYFV